MGKFDLDDLLNDLGPGLEGVPDPSSADADTDDAGMFVRQDPAEIPRPPDLTGRGLGAAGGVARGLRWVNVGFRNFAGSARNFSRQCSQQK